MERNMQCNSTTLNDVEMCARARSSIMRSSWGRDQRCLDFPNSRHPTQHTLAPHTDHLYPQYWFSLYPRSLDPLTTESRLVNDPLR